MITFPNAKINLGLYITAKRSDGYHNLQSCFVPIAWQDALEILLAEEFSLSISGLEVSGNLEDNLCYKAYQILSTKYPLSPVHIFLHKAIPMGAGLGGGSADATFTLKMLNQLFDLKIDNQELANYASQLGSDCAFFIENTPKFCFEKGDQMRPIRLPQLKKKHLVLVYPNFGISTQEAYAGIKPKAIDFDLQERLEQAPLETWKNWLYNDFEAHLFVKYPILAQIKQQLYEQGAIYAAMSGSGSTIFGIFEEEPDKSFFANYTCKFTQFLF
ncbi:MAG: 4-(cytidine 5'-diphospho)-2-C-methyl-D-erythritol kinase [Raineya sp.]